MPKKNTTDEKKCVGCGGPVTPNAVLLQTGDFICERCVEYMYKIVAMHKNPYAAHPSYGMGSPVPPKSKKPETKASELPHPEEIKEYLDQFVIGQDLAKRALCVAVYNHYKRLDYNATRNTTDVELEKSNILFLGPTGSGKTLLAQTMAKMLDVPFAIADATVLTEAGYVGEDVDSIIVRLLQAADYDVERAERGIIFIDEIDKIARKGGNPSITRDVSGEGVQQGLLKLLEGTVASVPPKGGRKHPEQPLVQVNTKNILFICGGAFEGLDKIVASRVDKGGMGFGARIRHVSEKSLSDMFKQVEPDDLVRFGMMPELIGRLPVYVSLDELSEDALINILSKPKNSILKQYTKVFELDGIELTITDEAKVAIVAETVKRKTGARGLRSVVEQVLQPFMFSMPGKSETKLVIDEQVVLNTFITEEE